MSTHQPPWLYVSSRFCSASDARAMAPGRANHGTVVWPPALPPVAHAAVAAGASSAVSGAYGGGPPRVRLSAY